MGNLVLNNPSEPPETLKAIITAINGDEALLASQGSTGTANGVAITALQNAAGYALYTAALAVAPIGHAILKTGTAGAMTLVNPAIGDSLILLSSGGVWLAVLANGVTIA